MSPQGIHPPAYRSRLGYHAMLLAGMALFASTGLVIGNLSTRDDIAERLAEDMRASLTQVIPAALHDNDLLSDTLLVTRHSAHRDEPVRVFRARRDGVLSAFAFRVTGQGYAGAIDIMMGVDMEGAILGVRVITHAETPGLGDRIEIRKSDWIRGFEGLSLANTPDGEWKVRKDGGRFDQFSGATITPRAVVRAVHQGLLFYHQYQDALTVEKEPSGESES